MRLQGGHEVYDRYQVNMRVQGWYEGYDRYKGYDRYQVNTRVQGWHNNQYEPACGIISLLDI